MKKTLLSIALLLSVGAFAQQTIPAFYASTVTTEGTGQNIYAMVTSGADLNEAATGENLTWNFTNLTQVTESATAVTPATGTDIDNYPGTALVVNTVTTGGGTTNYYLGATVTGGASIVGMQTGQFNLEYSDAGFIGDFPLAYGYTNSDPVAGSFVYGNYSGTFTGTGTTTVDAYGTLTTNVGVADATAAVRLKTVQSLNLFVGPAPVGTFTQTIYSYYNTEVLSGAPIFRSITNVLAVGGQNQTQSTLESYLSTETMDAAMPQAPLALSIAPNPVNNTLTIVGSAEVTNVSVIDASGRVVAQAAANNVNVSHLSAGIYYVTVAAQSGTKTLKMLKQ